MIEVVELIIRQPNHPDRVVEIGPGETRLGRAEDNEVVLSDVGVSRRHAHIVFQGDEVKYIDLGSGNGSYYRGQRVDEQVLADHDEIMIDPFVLTFRLRKAGSPSGADTLGGVAARLDVVSAPGIFRSYFPIEAGGLSIGRADEQDLVLPDPAASRQHCRIQARGSGFVLVDNNSANGVFLNGRRVTDADLTHGDRIRIGNSEFRFADASAPLKSFGGGVTPVPLAGRTRGGSSAVPKIILAATTSLVLLAVILALILLLVVQLQQRQRLTSYTNPSPPPTWSVSGAPDVKVFVTAFEIGRAAIENSKPQEAFVAFTRALELRPGDPSAERFALLAAEFQVYDVLEKRLDARAAEGARRDASRDELLAVATSRTPRARRARLILLRTFPDDPKVQAELSLPRTTEQIGLDEKLAGADAAMDQGSAADALELYREVFEGAAHDDALASAAAGMQAARRVLAKESSESWARGVIAQQDGDVETAAEQFAAVRKVYPSNPSVAARTRVAGAGEGTP